jgi:type III secretion protein D
MDMTQPVVPLQLRVLTGLHEGAVVALASPAEGAQGLSLAAGQEADVRLRDAPGQAVLNHEGGVWTWREAGFEQAVAPGHAWRWGQVVLALAAADQPWPEALPPLAFDRQSFESTALPEPLAAAHESAEADGAGLDAAGQTLPGDAPEATAEPDPEPKPVRGANRPGRWLLVAVSAIVVVLGGLVVFVLLSTGTAVPQTQALSPAPSSGPVNLALVEKTIAQFGLQGAVKARVREDGRLVLRGVVPDIEALEAFTAAMARQTRRYTSLLLTQTEFEERARALQANLPAGIEASPEPGGLLVLLGKRDDVDWVLARQLVDSDLPEVVTVDHRLVITPEAVNQWREDRQTLRQAAAAATPAKAPPQAQPPAGDVGAAVMPVQPLVPAVVPMPPLPEIHAVVGGARPYLVLGDGSKWLPGGKISALTLVSIDNEQLVFEDAQGQTFKKPR